MGTLLRNDFKDGYAATGSDRRKSASRGRSPVFRAAAL